MMKKLLATLLLAVLVLTAVAFAEDYRASDIAFSYDEAAFQIETDDVGENNDHLVVLTARDEAWGTAYIRFYVSGLVEGEELPTAESLAEALPEVEVTEGDWKGFSGVVMYNDGDEDLRLIALENGRLLTVGVGVTELEDEAVAQARDQQIDAVLDSLTVVAETVEGSSLYTQEDMGRAMDAVEAEAAQWEGIDVIGLSYAGDACNTRENIEWLSGLKDKEYAQVLQFKSSIRTDASVQGALDPNTDYTDYDIWLARTEGGDWEAVTWGKE